MQSNQIINSQSGSLQEGVAAPYDLTISDVFREAWHRVSGFKGSVLAAVFLAAFALAAVNLSMVLIVDLLSTTDSNLESFITGGLSLAITIASYPLFAGILMMGLHRAADADVDYKIAFAYFSYTLPIIIAVFCTSILITLGFVLLIIPGIYLSIAYIFTLPLIIEKEMDFWQAMETSRKAVHQHWFKIFFIYAIMGIIYFISMIPFGIGLIWSIPLFVALHGVLYRRIFGIDSIKN